MDRGMEKYSLPRGAEESEELEIDLLLLIRDFWKLLRRSWRLFSILVLLTFLGVVGWSYLTYDPLYQCSATFTVATSSEGSTSYGFSYSQNTADQLSKTFPYILESNYFKSVLAESMGTNTVNGTLTAETVSESNMVTMSVTSSSAGDAMTILTTAIEIYPETARFVLGDIQFHMMNEPVMPTEPYNQPSLIRVAVLGAAAGLFVGALALGVMAFFRRTVRSIEQMNRITNLKCLAAVPEVKFKARKNQGNSWITLEDRRVPFGYKESLRSLQIRLERGLKKKGGKVVLVTSTISGEGKTTLALNLAKILAAGGKRALLIDGDLRKPSLAERLGCEESLGLGDVIRQKLTSVEELTRLEEAGLYFLGGKTPENHPVRILSRQRFKKILERYREEMDYILIDTPPCGIFQDASMIQELADGVIYVVKYDDVPQQRVREGLASLRKEDCFMGYVFNCYEHHANDYGYGNYGYGRYGYGRYGYRQEQKEKG